MFLFKNIISAENVWEFKKMFVFSKSCSKFWNMFVVQFFSKLENTRVVKKCSGISEKMHDFF